MKDSEIIKGLECCQPQYEKNCEECPYAKHKKHYISGINCGSLMRKDILDLINRQKAEIEKYKKKADALMWDLSPMGGFHDD